MRALIAVSRVSHSDYRHELQALRQIENIKNPFLVLEDFTYPGGSQSF